MNKNYLHVVLWLVLLTVIALLGMEFLPRLEIGGTELRQVDILGDIKPQRVESADSSTHVDDIDALVDSIIIAKSEAADTVKRPRQDTTRVVAGIEPQEPWSKDIEDFSNGANGGMQSFLNAMGRMESSGGVVRIAVIGDSYIEGDILSADLRALMQEKYGGCGVGFVPITSDCYGFRRSVRHSFSGWQTHKVAGGGRYDASRAIVSGYYFIPDSMATVELRGQSKYYTHLDTCSQSSIYFHSRGHCTVWATVNGNDRQTFSIEPADGIQRLTVNGSIGRVRWSVGGSGGNFTFYGASMDCDRGVTVDNFSIRGASGVNIGGVSDAMMAAFNAARHYDLIILVFGQNAITSTITNYDSYKNHMCQAIEKLKNNCPGSSILVMSVGDREERRDGEMRTMKGVLAMVKYQRLIAAESGVAFWNLFESMGGEGSIYKMVHSKPSEANRDYTHINFLGGKRIAGYLFDALERERGY